MLLTLNFYLNILYCKVAVKYSIKYTKSFGTFVYNCTFTLDYNKLSMHEWSKIIMVCFVGKCKEWCQQRNTKKRSTKIH